MFEIVEYASLLSSFFKITFVLLPGAVTYLNPEADNFVYNFTLVEVYGAAHLYFPRKGTVLKVDTIYGDDTGYIHVAPRSTLNITGVSEYKRINVTWGPYIYEDGTIVLPNGTFEMRETRSREYPSLTRSSHVTFWGRMIGDLGHLMVGYGGRVTFAQSSPRFLRFVGMTIQKNGRLEYMSRPNNESDKWIVEVVKGVGPVHRDGLVTVEAEGKVTATSLHITAESLVVDPEGYLLLDGKGYPAGICFNIFLYLLRILFI